MGNVKSLKFYLLLLFCCSCFIQTHAQEHVPFATWLIPGVNYQATEKFNVIVQPAWNPQLHIGYFHTQGLIKINKHVTLNAGYMFIRVPRQFGINRYQHTLLNGVIFSFPFNNFIFDTRNWIWNRFINNEKDFHIYRNRFRLSHLTKVDNWTFRIYFYDEVSLFLRNGEWSRNRVGPGINIEFREKAMLDVSYVRQNDSESGKINLLFVQFTFLIPNANTVTED